MRDFNQKSLEIHYWGHAGWSVFYKGCHLVMDPVFDEPFEHGNTYFNPPRKINRAKLPPVSVIYISHAHGDHFDKPTLQYLSRFKPHVFCPDDFEILTVLKSYNFDKITRLKAWRTQSFGPYTLIPTASLSYFFESHRELGLIVQAGSAVLWNQVDTVLDLKTIWTAKKQLRKQIDVLFAGFQPLKIYCGYWPEETAFPARRLEGLLYKALAVEARHIVPSSFSLKVGGVLEPLNSRMYQVTKPEFIHLLKLKAGRPLSVFDMEAGCVLRLDESGGLTASPDSSFFIKRTGDRVDLSRLPCPEISHLPLSDFEMSEKDKELIVTNMQKLPSFLKQLMKKEFCYWLELCRVENYTILIEVAEKKETLKFLLYNRLEKLSKYPINGKWDYRFHYRAEDLIKRILSNSHYIPFFIYRNTLGARKNLKGPFAFYGLNEDNVVDDFCDDHFLSHWPFYP